MAGLVLYLLASWTGGVSPKDMLLLALAPGVFINAFFGQNGFLTAALLIGGLADLDRRPVASGVLFGILTIKPQLLLPVLLMMTGRWRVIAAALATMLALAVLTTFWFGPDVWLDYLHKVGPQQQALLTHTRGTLLLMVSSAFVNARLIGLSPDVAGRRRRFHLAARSRWSSGPSGANAIRPFHSPCS